MDSVERRWVSVIDSARWRRFAKRGPGARLFQSRAYRRLAQSRRFIHTRLASRREPDLFRDVRTFCMFIGQAKSGGTMIGSMLDAHPNAVVADEVDLVRFVEEGFRRDQIFHLMLKGSRREAMKGRVTARRLGGYSFSVPGQWQGRFAELIVVGESRAGPSTRRLAAAPDLLDQVSRVMGEVDLRFIQIVRNPFDPISAMMLRSGRTFTNAIDDYFLQCTRLEDLRSRIACSDLLVVRYEEMVRSPQDQLVRICRYLGLEAEPAYLAACAAILDETPRVHRFDVDWDSDRIADVQRRIADFAFLDGYRYSS
jgi:hypothetical protein